MKALWAFEPFHQDKTRVKGVYNLITQLVEFPSDISLGFIVTRTESKLNWAFKIPYKERFSVYPKKLTKEVLRKANISIEDKKIHIVDFETSSNTKAVDRLLALAKLQGADLITLYTHARKGFKRLVIGSFAETAIHRSKINLLLVNPNTKFSDKIKNSFYASDFSPESRGHLKEVIQICKATKTSLTVFHVAQVIYKWSLDESNPEIHAYRKKVNKMEAWVEQECQNSEIKAEIIVKSELRSIDDLFEKAVLKSKADLIIVVAKSGKLTSLMGGSFTRQIVRSSTKPVLVLK